MCPHLSLLPRRAALLWFAGACAAVLAAPFLRGQGGFSPDGQSLEWFFFPPSPPPLGAEVAAAAGTRQSGTPPAMRAFLTEPFYTPLSVRLVHVQGERSRNPPLQTEERARLDTFIDLRLALLDELYARIPAILRLEPDERLAAFAELARHQEARLRELEGHAEWLRENLGRTESWNRHRRWRLNRGSLRQSRERTYVLEFQVARASAYYQAGYSPAQRTLIRELAIEMSEHIATGGVAPDSSLLYFSPHTTRITRPASAPAPLQGLIEQYAAAKRRLKDELREIIYETDGVLLEAVRTRRIQELATAQSATLDWLETAAEEIRRGLAQVPGHRRYRGPPTLGSALEARLQAYAGAEDQIARDRNAFVHERVMRARADPAQSPREAAARARGLFEMEQGPRLLEHEREAEGILEELLRELPPEEAARLDGTADTAIRDYLARRGEQNAYADYDLAVLEPGLSPAQRRLLLAAAMARLRLVLPPPERQPVEPPGTLYGIGP